MSSGTAANMFALQTRNLMKIRRVWTSTNIPTRDYAKATRSSYRQSIFEVGTTEDFEKKVKRSDKPVIVDFCASWCRPCKMLTPRLENIISEKAGAIKLAKVDVDENCNLALDYDVGSVPALLVMHNGKVLNRMVGLQDTDAIRKWVDQAINNPKIATEEKQ